MKGEDYMAKGFSVRFFGERALFSRPELKVERYSYDVPTPSALIGMIESIFWHYGVKYKIDRIKVIKPIRRESVKRNEVKHKISNSKVLSVCNGKKALLYLNRNKDIVMRNSSILRNVEYIVDFHFDVDPEKMNDTDSEAKFASMINRRIEKGQCYKQPYFGCREFPAYFEKATGNELSYYEDVDRVDFGIMLYGMDYGKEQWSPMFYNCVMKNGVINLTDVEVLK